MTVQTQTLMWKHTFSQTPQNLQTQNKDRQEN